MYEKDDFEVITKLSSNYIGKSYFVQLTSTKKNYKYELRIMYKIKVVDLNEKQLVLYEKKYRLQLRHPFIVNAVCTFQDNDNLYFLNEMPLGGYLFSLLNKSGKFSLKSTKFYIAEILLALNYLHRKGRCYYHLIPNNILLDSDGHIKLKYDFLNLNGLDDETYNNNVEYIGIEYFLKTKMTFISDFWSLGVIMYELVFGYSPFRRCTVEETINNIKYGKYKIPETDIETEDLIRILLCKQSFYKMSSVNAFMYIKNHRFFADIDWNAIENKKICSPHSNIADADEVFKGGVPLSKFTASLSKKRDCDGYHRMFSGYSTIDDFGCMYEMDLN